MTLNDVELAVLRQLPIHDPEGFDGTDTDATERLIDLGLAVRDPLNIVHRTPAGDETLAK